MERLFIPEVCVGFFQVDLTDGAVKALTTAWAAAQIATPALPDIAAGAYVLLIDAEGNNIRFRNDGTDPTTGAGNRIIKDTQLVYTAASRSSLKFIAETAANCKANIGVYKHVV